MKTIQLIGELALGVSALLMIFELLPPHRQESIDNHVNRQLTWSLLVSVLALAVGIHLSLRLFAYVSPFAVFLVMFLLWIGGKASALAAASDDNLPFGCLLFLIGLPLVIAVASHVKQLELQLFYGSLTAAYVVGVLALFFPSSGTKGQFILSVLSFLLIGLPSGIGHWVNPDFVESLLSPYHWLSGFMREHSWFASNVAMPGSSPEQYVAAYTSTVGGIQGVIPEFLADSRPFIWFRGAGGGYLLFLGLIVQALFLCYAWYVLKLCALIFWVPLIRFSNWIKRKSGLERRRIPIASIVLGCCGAFITMVVKITEYFGG